jgi:hypothetical protein
MEEGTFCFLGGRHGVGRLSLDSEDRGLIRDVSTSLEIVLILRDGFGELHPSLFQRRVEMVKKAGRSCLS